MILYYRMTMIICNGQYNNIQCQKQWMFRVKKTYTTRAHMRIYTENDMIIQKRVLISILVSIPRPAWFWFLLRNHTYIRPKYPLASDSSPNARVRHYAVCTAQTGELCVSWICTRIVFRIRDIRHVAVAISSRELSCAAGR